MFNVFLRALLLQPNTTSALTVLYPTTPQHLHLCLEPFSLLKYPRNPCCSLLPCYFPSVNVEIPVKYMKFYFSRNSDPWEVKLRVRWKLLCSGNTADAKSSSKPGFPCLVLHQAEISHLISAQSSSRRTTGRYSSAGNSSSEGSMLWFFHLTC